MSAGRLLVLAALCLVAGAAGAADGTALRGTVPRSLARLPDAGPVPAEQMLDHVMVFLGLRDRDGLEAFIAARQDPRSPRFGARLDAAEIADRFGARRAEYERVRGWFARQGLEVVRDSPFRVAFVLRGPAATFERALATRLRRVRHRGRTHVAPASDPVLPPDVAGAVRGLVGLDDLPAYRPLHRIPQTGTIGLSPDDFAAAYQATGLRQSFTGAGRAIAVVARSNFEDSDIDGFESLFGVQLNPVRKLAGRDDPGVLSDEGEETEVLLDTQWAGALAPGAQLNVVIGSPRGNIPEALEKAVNDREGDVITISFGLCEPFAPIIAAELFDAFYAIANAQGQTVLVAAGDGGATECDIGDDVLAVNALASSPHAVAVGGTSFDLADDGSLPVPLVERIWADDFGGGGGGESALFARPRYQLGAGLPATIGGRLMPDLAVAAGPDTPGYIIFEDGQPQVIGGTSAGAPALASVLALVNERLAAAGGFDGLGHVLPSLYRLAAEQARGVRAPVFRDVTLGSNALPGSVGFPASPGFDLASGWGTPITDALAEALGEPARCEPAIEPVGGCVVPALGPKKKACSVAWLVDRTNLALKRDVPSRTQRCRDGDPTCDEDGVADGRCTVSVALCLNVFDFRSSRLSPRRVPRCEPGSVRRVQLQGGGRHASLAADDEAELRAAIGALPALPTTLRGACTASVQVGVPAASALSRGRVNLRARTQGSLGSTSARVALLCDP
jgi:kumamolisin